MGASSLYTYTAGGLVAQRKDNDTSKNMMPQHAYESTVELRKHILRRQKTHHKSQE
jgi:hypothetical protein